MGSVLNTDSTSSSASDEDEIPTLSVGEQVEGLSQSREEVEACPPPKKRLRTAETSPKKIPAQPEASSSSETCVQKKKIPAQPEASSSSETCVQKRPVGLEERVVATEAVVVKKPLVALHPVANGNIKPSPVRLPKRMAKKSKLIEKDPISVYKIPVHKVVKDANSHVAKCEVGVPNPDAPGEKVLMLVGATGSGKTTLINGMVNYIMGVEWDDPLRFKLILEESSKSQAYSQTTWITAYKLHRQGGSPLPYTLTIIDTPGFGDTRGLVRDQEIAGQIKELFSLKGECGVDQIHGIGFVAQSPLARLTPPQKYIFDSILAIFGKDIGGNIFLMVTFADGQRPPLLDAVKEAHIPFCKSFKFNNSAWFARNDAADMETFDKLFWGMGKSSCAEFFKELERAESKSLHLTREVLKERFQLEAFIQGLQPKIRAGLCKIDQLQQEQDILARHEAQILENRNFEYQVMETKQRKVDLIGEYVTNCIRCNYTCHYPCTVPADCDKYQCSVMKTHDRESAVCSICPGQCSWQQHFNNPYRFDLYQEPVVKTSEDLKRRYNQAIDGKTKVESMITNIETELQQLNDTVLSMIRDVQQSLRRLEEIALKPNPLTEVEYIDLLIQSEKQEAQPGWIQRVQYYEKVRDQAHLLSKLKDEKAGDRLVLAKARQWMPSHAASGSIGTTNTTTEKWMPSHAASGSIGTTNTTTEKWMPSHVASGSIGTTNTTTEKQ